MALRIVTANTDWAKRGDADYIAHLCENADVVLLQEAKDTRLADVAPEGWTALQDTSSPAKMGTGMLVRDAAAKVNHWKLTLGVNPFLKTGKRVKMLARWIIQAHLTETATKDTHEPYSAHFPPLRFSPLQPLYRSRLATAVKGHPHATVGTDANQPIGNVAKALGFTAHGRGIVGLLTGPGIKVTNVQVRSWGIAHGLTDHPSVQATCESVTAPKPPPPTPPPPGHKLFIPGAIQEPIPQTSTDPNIIPVGPIFHVAVSESTDLHDFFEHDGGIESTGYILRDGTIKQYRPLNVECDAQFDGNSWIGADGKRYGFTSWETQGMGTGEWTSPQIASIQKIIDFHHDQWATPYRVAPAWNAPGVGYHCLFPQWNHNNHSCPGPDRVAQFKRVIVPWLRSRAS